MDGTLNWNDFSGRAVLITGGTKGIGFATGIAFGRRGAQVTLTHKWESADTQAVRSAFAEAGAPEPRIIDADASDIAGVRTVLSAIRKTHDSLHTFVSNVAHAPAVRALDDYNRRDLARSIDYSAWPLVSHVQAIKEIFGSYPKYVLAMSSAGAESYLPNYDIMAAAKAVLETLCRYMNLRLRVHGTRVNVLSTRFARTESMSEILGHDFEAFLDEYAPGLFAETSEIGEAAAGLCSGLMDAIGGQVITVDHGAGIFDNFSRLFQERDRLTPLPRRKP